MLKPEIVFFSVFQKGSARACCSIHRYMLLHADNHPTSILRDLVQPFRLLGDRKTLQVEGCIVLCRVVTNPPITTTTWMYSHQYEG